MASLCADVLLRNYSFTHSLNFEFTAEYASERILKKLSVFNEFITKTCWLSFLDHFTYIYSFGQIYDFNNTVLQINMELICCDMVVLCHYFDVIPYNLQYPSRLQVSVEYNTQIVEVALIAFSCN